MLNPNDDDAEVTHTVYFENRGPAVLAPQLVAARRVRCIRTNETIDGSRARCPGSRRPPSSSRP